jgi:hypothetical protein
VTRTAGHSAFSSSFLALVFAVTIAPGAAGQMLGEIAVVNCPYADSLLGTEWEKGRVTAGRIGGEVVMTSSTSGPVRTTIQMSVTLQYRDPTPPRDPHGSLSMTVFDDRMLAAAMNRPDTTSLMIVVDDSITLNLGSPVENDVRGATRASHLPVNVALPRGAFLALARARKARAFIAGRSYPVGRKLLREMSRTYRAAVCMPPESIPPLRSMGN